MNNKSKNITDKSVPYRNLGMGKITAPVKPQDQPKCRVIKSEGDLRIRGGKA